VVAVEGALCTEQDMNDFIHQSWYHPQVSNETKGRMMHGATSPTAPEAFRRETIQTYMAGWPPVFIGDLHYYVEDYDLTGKAGEIDTNQIPVYILNGEYDYDGSWERGELAHREIAGSRWIKMDGLGHFPMSEDPDKFYQYISPVLKEIADQAQ
jgi:pimeloyl-ACP methyl ester carboxylesterase